MDYDFYNKHYLKTREDGAIIDAWSDGPLRDKPTDKAICFNDKGSYQLRLIINGLLTEENPPIRTYDGIPLYKFENGIIKSRTEEEISTDRALIPPSPPTAMEQLRADVDFILVMSNLM